MGRRDPRESGSGGMVGERGEPVSAEVSLRELDAPHPRGPRTDPSGSADREGVRSLDRTIRPGGWRIRHGRFQERPPVHNRERHARTRAIRLRGPSRGPQRVRVACDESGQEWRVGVFFGGAGYGFLGGDGGPPRVFPSEKGGGDGKTRRTPGRGLSPGGRVPTGGRVPAVVPVPLPGPLLL